MHIAVMNPAAITPEELGQAFVEKEMEIAREQLIASGKPQQFIDKILAGKRAKLHEEVCLTSQKFIKNDKMSIQEYLDNCGKALGLKLAIQGYKRFGIGR